MRAARLFACLGGGSGPLVRSQRGSQLFVSSISPIGAPNNVVSAGWCRLSVFIRTSTTVTQKHSDKKGRKQQQQTKNKDSNTSPLRKEDNSSVPTESVSTLSPPPSSTTPSVSLDSPSSAAPTITCFPSVPPPSPTNLVTPESAGSKPRVERGRSFITAVRAMNEYLLKPGDLAPLGCTKRRSPFENEPPILVYWRWEVRRKAIDKWGSLERLSQEKKKRSMSVLHQEALFSVKKMLKDYRRGQRKDPFHAELMAKLASSSSVVYTAVAVNAANAVAKGVAFLVTGSSCLFSETLHSIADTLNQLILAWGIHKSAQSANTDHPYGYSNVRYVASLISGVGIFCLGSGVALYHGVHSLYSPPTLADIWIGYTILACSLVSESVTLTAAVNNIRRGAASHGRRFWSYVRDGGDPSVSVVLLEDMAAVLGVFIAGSCMALSAHTGSMVYDAAGSLAVGALLGSVASFIIYTNAHALVGKSIRPEQLERINIRLEEDHMVRGIHDVKGIDMGNGLVRYKAEVDFDGRELTKKFLERSDGEMLLNLMKEVKTESECEQFVLKHGEAIVDTLGAEIDRIEQDLKIKFPFIRHIDLEIL